MIRSITVNNYLGDSITLELMKPDCSGFIVKSISGLGPAKGNVNTVEVLTNDGGVFNSAHLGIRNIVMNLVFMETGTETVENIRHKSYKYFPVKKKVNLSIKTDSRVSEIEGYVEHNEPAIFSSQEGCQISIICPYPYFYSAKKSNITLFNGVGPLFEFPFQNESLSTNMLKMGEIHKNNEHVVTYDGDAEIGVTIIIYAIGAATNVMIYNAGTREVMRIDTDKLINLTGHGIIAGDEITIKTTKGNKSITLLRNGIAINILNCLDKNADWFQLVRGDNAFGYIAETGNNNLQFRIENRVIYEGV